MATIRAKVSVEFAGGLTRSAVADQRDYAAAEGLGVSPRTAHTWVRAVAWAALVRTKQYPGSWTEFNEVDCVEAIDGEPEGDDESLDPGRSAPTGGS